MGGYVALTIALSEPEAVRSLVLAGTGAGGPDRVPRPPHVAAAFTAALGLPYEEFARRTMPYTFASGWTDASPERFEAILAARLEHPTPYATIEAHAAACYAFYAAGCEVERVAHPALVVHGTEDLIVPIENGRRLAQRLPNAEYFELERRGHNLPLEDPETFARLVRGFLASVEES
jgi:3-oxoadipate enol-lactonase